jgi:hypothetical protein
VRGIAAVFSASFGSLDGEIVEDAVPELAVILGGTCGGEMRGRAQFDTNHKRFMATAAGQDCRGSLALSLTLERP